MFKPGETIVCMNVLGKSYKGKKKPNIKTVTKYKTYEVVEKINPYNDNVFIINDIGQSKSYASRRFISIEKFRYPKIKKLINKIKNN